jgi:hypothetical protein
MEMYNLIIKHRIVISLTSIMLAASANAAILTTKYGARGDGRADDTAALQKALNECSDTNQVCEIPAGRTHRVTHPIFMWGGASLKSSQGGGINFYMANDSSAYLFNFGIAYKRNISNANGGEDVSNIRPPFKGTISGITFTMSGGVGGRILWFWRAEDAQVINNKFYVGKYLYSATGSGSNYDWLYGNAILHNITVSGNKMTGSQTGDGHEGIGFDDVDGLLIQNNIITGIGDDLIASHSCRNVKILSNILSGVDGQIFVNNSVGVEIGDNTVSRMKSPVDGIFYSGLSLIHIGWDYDNSFIQTGPVNENINIHDNLLYLPPGAKDLNGMINIHGVRKAQITNNWMVNDSKESTHSALHLWSADFGDRIDSRTGTTVPAYWVDPTLIDCPDPTAPLSECNAVVAKVRDVVIDSNVSMGRYPLEFVETAYTCSDIPGPVIVKNNMAPVYYFCSDTSFSNNKGKIVSH